MRPNLKWLAVLIFLGFFVMLGAQVYSSPNSPAPAPTLEKPRQNPDELEITPAYYMPYLKGEKKLTFTPDQQMLETIYGIIKNRYAETINQPRYYGAMRDEVKKLLKAADISLPSLDKVKLDSYFPQRAVDLLTNRLDLKLVYYACLMGISKGVDDDYTVFLDPGEYAKMQEMMDERGFGGVGMAIGLENNKSRQLFVEQVFEDTPAFKAGILSGDEIKEVNGVSTKGISAEDGQSRIRGAVGTQVTLLLLRPGTAAPFKVTITRQLIVIHSVQTPPDMLAGNIGYVKLRLFSNNTIPELNDALNQLQNKGMKALILDIRNNGGGYLQTAVDLCGLFLPKDSVVVKVGENGGQMMEMKSHNEKPLNFPIVLLVNKYSASASEITTGAMQDFKRATIVGEKTFGKGSVQQIMPLKEGTAFKVTISHFFTPQGRKINKLGLTPDVTVPMDIAKIGKPDDPQIKKAVEILKSKISN